MHIAAARRAGLDVLGGWDPNAAVSGAGRMPITLPSFDSLDAALAAVRRWPSSPARLWKCRAGSSSPPTSGVAVLVEKPVAIDAAHSGRSSKISNAAGAVGGRRAAAPFRAADRARLRAAEALRDPPGERAAGTLPVLERGLGARPRNRRRRLPAQSGRTRHRPCPPHFSAPDLRVTHAAMRRWHGEAVEDHAMVHLARDAERPRRSRQATCTRTTRAATSKPGSSGRTPGRRSRLRTSCVAAGLGGSRFCRPVPQPERYDAMMADIARRLTRRAPPAATLRDLLRAMQLIDDALPDGRKTMTAGCKPGCRNHRRGLVRRAPCRCDPERGRRASRRRMP